MPDTKFIEYVGILYRDIRDHHVAGYERRVERFVPDSAGGELVESSALHLEFLDSRPDYKMVEKIEVKRPSICIILDSVWN
jgi:hypothetical protein